MALSTYFNLDFHQTPNSEMSTFHEGMRPELIAPKHHHLLAYHPDEESFILPNTFFDSYLDPTTSFLYPEIYPLLLPYDPIISLSDIFPTEDHHSLPPCPKRQKCFYEEQDHPSMDLAPINSFDGFVPNPCSLPAEEIPLPELFSDGMPEFKVPQLPQGRFGACDDDHQNEYEKTSKEKITISAQSIVARERRRKITRKTQELGKLVPGGSKMNTAEMLHAAGKYVQYLQAQVQMLRLMNTLQEDKAAPPTEDLQALLLSLSVQEKMYSEEKCFVPTDLITTLTNHVGLQSRPSILKDLEQLIGTDIEKKAKQE